MTDQNGQPLRVVKLPMPEPVWFEGRRLPASYANFYIANKRVLVPVFNSANDLPALNTLQQLFPSRRIDSDLLRRFHLGPGRDPLHDATTTGIKTAEKRALCLGSGHLRANSAGVCAALVFGGYPPPPPNPQTLFSAA